MSKHTEGPWKAEIRQNSICILSDTKAIALMCVKPDTDHLYKPAVVEANAHLIAAAPETTEMLKDIAKRIADSEEWWMSDPERGGFDLEAIEALIAKATG